jgi:hypothetical protein
MWLAMSLVGWAGMGAAPAAQPPASIPCTICATDPVEPIWTESGTRARIKSPAQQMHFTAGFPLRILADAIDANNWMCPPGHPPYVCPGTEVRFFVDGQLAGTAPPNPNDFNLWELRLPNGLPAGSHVLTIKYVPYNPSTGGGGTPIDGYVPITIHVDPAPTHGGTVVLDDNVVLGGATALDWTDKLVIGNGFRITSASGYSGNVTIHGSTITGLGGFTATGLDVTTSGNVSIQNSTFEATGAMRLAGTGGASIVVRNNELRANNLITYQANNPDVPVMLELSGTTTGARVVQGNRIGAGILRFGGNGWQIGGLAQGEGNILIGVRAVLHLVNSSNDTIQGNYLHHDYHGGFSQGFNIWLEGSSDNELIEHNVIRGGSWPVQSAGGEFRYNLVIDSGHTFWRSARNNVRIHHNVFANASGPNTGYDAGISTFSGESGLRVYNNTFDMGGTVGGFDGPGIRIGAGSTFTSIRNNLFTQFVNISTQWGRAVISAPEGQVSSARVTSADYNAFFSPNGSANIRYLPNIVSNTPGNHDVQANPLLAGASASEVPYRISEGCLWLKDCTTGQVLSHYREVYRPTAASPLIDAGDPADGVGTAIGAVGPDDTNPADLFGRGLETTPPGPDTQPPAGSITINNGAPETDNATVQLTLSAFDASGVPLMRLANDGGAFGTPEPYVTSRTWTLSTSGADGPRTVSVQYQDGAGNWSGSFTATITLDTTPEPTPTPNPSGLVAAYGFEEGTGMTTANAAPGGNTLIGTLSNATWTTGRFGNALGFTGGESSWVTVQHAASLSLTTGMTISAWVRPTSAMQNEPTILMKQGSGNLAYALYANSGDGTPNAWYVSNGDWVSMFAASGHSVPLNTWTHIAATFDGATLRIFHNGQLSASQASAGAIDVASGVLRIGGNSVWSNEGFPGVIDEVRIYNRALSATEIQADMTTPVGGGGQ